MNELKYKQRKSKLSILLHLSAWFVFFILPQILSSYYWEYQSYFAWVFYLNAAIYILIFYINYFWLVPKFYFNEKKTPYFFLSIILIIGFYFVLIYIPQIVHNHTHNRIFGENFNNFREENNVLRNPFQLIQIYQYAITSFVVTGFSFGLRVFEKHSASEKRQKELEKEKLNSELAFLKNQVSPHFFFNTLNNIYSLIEVNTNDAREAVMKLSKLMRYLLYESESGKTQLRHEIKFMEHYIDLMRLRLSPKVELNFQFPEKDNNLKVPPLLFIPFIENAFKHGISYREKSFIYIILKLEGQKMFFSCKNTIGKQLDKEINGNHSGIGLENVKKRLKLLFPETHILSIESSKTEFNVNLEIDLKNS